MRKHTLLFMALPLVASSVFAVQAADLTTHAATSRGGFVEPHNTAAPRGGFVDNQSTVVTVAQAKTLADDAWVTLRGNIERRIDSDHYLFRDSSGTITADIDTKRWNGQVITAKDKVEIQGEIDKDWNSIEIDVKQINKLP